MFQGKMTIALLILVLTMSWGYSWVLMKIGLEYMEPFTFSGLRFFIGSLTLMIILFFLKAKGVEQKKKPLSKVMILGFLQTALVFGLVMYGMQFVEAGKSSILLYTMPIWSSFLAVYFLQESLNVRKIQGLLLGIVGLVFIIVSDLIHSISLESTLGIVIILVASLVWSVSNIFYKKQLAGGDQLSINCFQMFFGSLLLGAIALILERDNIIIINRESIYALFFTGVVASALSFAIWFYLLTVVSTFTATMSSLLVPVFGMLFSVIILGEEFTFQLAIGSILILAGIFLAQNVQKSRST
ncbi:DMT family transporter [Bacillus sp. FJAT-44742]|uniref:DMT family transporter n=1 Tax=Bacillus sp. FJAT-44742 TaxID=2014005 RepID=UPI000C24B70E|nr:DMT family transporter [Bacillus sp. FJAT-44742]